MGQHRSSTILPDLVVYAICSVDADDFSMASIEEAHLVLVVLVEKEDECF